MADVIEDPFRIARFVLELRRMGVTDEATLNAMEAIDRGHFALPDAVHLALGDCIVPIPCGQFIARPVVVGTMIMAAGLKDIQGGRVLVVGAGSGYACAVMARMGAEVYGVERYRSLISFAREKLTAAGVEGVQLRHGDGLEGWPGHAPYDRILLFGSVEEVPEALYGQLAAGGDIIAPVERDDGQFATIFGHENRRGRVIAVSRFLPLARGVAHAL